MYSVLSGSSAWGEYRGGGYSILSVFCFALVGRRKAEVLALLAELGGRISFSLNLTSLVVGGAADEAPF